jgi:hypothetical protein
MGSAEAVITAVFEKRLVMELFADKSEMRYASFPIDRRQPIVQLTRLQNPRLFRVRMLSPTSNSFQHDPLRRLTGSMGG